MIYGELRPNQFGTTAALYHLSNETDFSGNNYHLTNNNSVSFVQGGLGICADLGSSNSNKYLGIGSELGLGSSSFSIVLRIKRHSEISSGTNGIYGFYRGTKQVGCNLLYEYNGGTRRIRYTRDASNVSAPSFYYNVSLDTAWHLLTLTFDGTTERIYLNEKEIITNTSIPNGSGSFGSFFFLGTTSGVYWSGFFDEAMASSTALTANQIRQIYAYQKGLLGRYA